MTQQFHLKFAFTVNKHNTLEQFWDSKWDNLREAGVTTGKRNYPEGRRDKKLPKNKR